jgi:hypothetical protein
MELFMALAAALGLAWLISLIGAASLDRAVSAFAKLVGGWKPDGWPRGVQEEDRDRPWGRPSPRRLTTVVASPELKPKLQRVHASTGPR